MTFEASKSSYWEDTFSKKSILDTLHHFHEDTVDILPVL
jgi:hypothetical protein